MGVCVEFAGTLRSMKVTVTYQIYVITHCHAFGSDEVRDIIFLAIGKADVGQARGGGPINFIRRSDLFTG